MVTTYVSETGFDQAELEWKALEEIAPTFKKNLRPVMLSLDFVSTSQNDGLIDALDFLKTKIEEKKALAGVAPDLFPKGFIKRKLRRYIIETKNVKVHGSTRKIMVISPNRYEFLVYSLLRQNLESGDVYIRDSVRFRSFEDDLIDDKRWDNKDQLIKELDLPILYKPIEQTLAELKGELEGLLVNVNQRIKKGEMKGSSYLVQARIFHGACPTRNKRTRLTIYFWHTCRKSKSGNSWPSSILSVDL